MWYSSKYRKRKQVVISNTTGTDYDRDVQIEIDPNHWQLTLDSKSRRDGIDMLFFDEEANTVLPYWIEEDRSIELTEKGFSLGTIPACILDTDLEFRGNELGGVYNFGEIFVEGSYFRDHQNNLVNVSNHSDGVVVSEAANYDAYIMYSQENVFTRFSANPPHVQNAQHFVAVKYEGGVYYYNDNTNWQVFTPAVSDRVVAKYSMDTTLGTCRIFKLGYSRIKKVWVKIEGLENGKSKQIWMYYDNPTARDHQNGETTFHYFDDFSEDLGDFNDDQLRCYHSVNQKIGGEIQAGIIDTDIVFTPNWWGGVTNFGEIGISGTYFTLPDGTTVNVGSLNNGLAVREDSDYNALIMYSEENVRTRFSGNPPHPSGADHFVNIYHSNGTFYYNDNNNAWYTFTPRSTDVVLATYDFDDDPAVGIHNINMLYADEAEGLKIYGGACITTSAVNLNEDYIVESCMQYNSYSSDISGALMGISTNMTGYLNLQINPLVWNANLDATAYTQMNSGRQVHMDIADGTTQTINVADNVNIYTMAFQTPYVNGIRFHSGGVAFFRDYEQKNSTNVSWGKNLNRVVLGRQYGGPGASLMDTQYHWVRVRKYLPTNMGITFGDEEQYTVREIADYALRITRPGVDINTATPEDFVMDTSQNRLKLFKSGGGVFRMGEGDLGYCQGNGLPPSFIIRHGLDYAPMVWFFVRSERDGRWHSAPVYYDYWKSDTSKTNSSKGLTAGWSTGGAVLVNTDEKRINFYIGRLETYTFGGDNANEVAIPYKYFIFVDPNKDAWYDELV